MAEDESKPGDPVHLLPIAATGVANTILIQEIIVALRDGGLLTNDQAIGICTTVAARFAKTPLARDPIAELARSETLRLADDLKRRLATPAPGLRGH